MNNKAYFVIALQGNALLKNEYYTFAMFPAFALERKQFDWSLSSSSLIFPTHRNLHGHSVRICTFHLPPHNYKIHENCVEKLRGDYGTLVSEYVRIRNGTLTYPKIKFNRSKLLRDDFLTHLENGHFDMCSFAVIENSRENITLTYPIQAISNCVAVPFGKDLPHYKYYTIILEKEVFFLLVFSLFVASLLLQLTNTVHGRSKPFWAYLCDMNFFGLILGLTVYIKKLVSSQSLVQKIILIILTLAGVIFNTSFSAFLQSFNSENPKEPTIDTLPKLLNSGKEIYIPLRDYNNIKKHADDYKVILPYLTTFPEDNYANFELNHTDYAFVINTIDWKFYNLKHQYNGQRKHVLSNICPFSNIARKIPCARNSLYVRTFSRFIVYVTVSGLLEQWLWKDLHKLPKSKNGRFETDKKFEDFELKDLRVIFLIYILFLILSVCVFIAELYWHKRQKTKRLLSTKQKFIFIK